MKDASWVSVVVLLVLTASLQVVQGEDTYIQGSLFVDSNLVVGTGIASGTNSVAEGELTEASGNYSHAEGVCTYAAGEAAHAEGDSTDAIGAASHAAGKNAYASNDYTYVWSDGTPVSSTTSQQYTVHASNGIRLLGGAVQGDGSSLSNISASSISGTISSPQIQDSSITSSKISNNSITSAKIEDGTVTVDDLSTNSIDARYVNKTGDTMSGTLDMNGNSVVGGVFAGDGSSLTNLDIFAFGGEIDYSQIYDESGNLNHADNFGITLCKSNNLWFGSFDGDDYARITDTGRLLDGASNIFCIMYWMRSDTTPSIQGNNMMIVSKHGTSCRDHGWSINWRCSDYGTCPTDGIQFQPRINSNCKLAGTTNAIDAGSWRHIAHRYDGSNIISFVNGIENASVFSENSLHDNSIDMHIGNNVDSGLDYFQGDLTGIAIYTNYVSASQIAEAYNAGVGSYADGPSWATTMKPVGDYSFLCNCIIDSNLVINVSTNADAEYKTISEAISSLDGRVIGNGSVTIQLADGLYHHANTNCTLISRPDAASIHIVGNTNNPSACRLSFAGDGFAIGSSYQIGSISGITIDGLGNTNPVSSRSYYAVSVALASSIRLDECIITNFQVGVCVNHASSAHLRNVDVVDCERSLISTRNSDLYGEDMTVSGADTALTVYLQGLMSFRRTVFSNNGTKYIKSTGGAAYYIDTDDSTSEITN